MVPGLLESLALKFGLPLGRKIHDWSKGSEARQLTELLKRKHPNAPRLLFQPDALGELWRYAGTGEFDHDRMLSVVRQVEKDEIRAVALVEAIETEQWRTKKDEEHTH